MPSSLSLSLWAWTTEPFWLSLLNFGMHCRTGANIPLSSSPFFFFLKTRPLPLHKQKHVNKATFFFNWMGCKRFFCLFVFWEAEGGRCSQKAPHKNFIDLIFKLPKTIQALLLRVMENSQYASSPQILFLTFIFWKVKCIILTECKFDAKKEEIVTIFDFCY